MSIFFKGYFSPFFLEVIHYFVLREAVRPSPSTTQTRTATRWYRFTLGEEGGGGGGGGVAFSLDDLTYWDGAAVAAGIFSRSICRILGDGGEGCCIFEIAPHRPGHNPMSLCLSPRITGVAKPGPCPTLIRSGGMSCGWCPSPRRSAWHLPTFYGAFNVKCNSDFLVIMHYN